MEGVWHLWQPNSSGNWPSRLPKETAPTPGVSHRWHHSLRKPISSPNQPLPTTTQNHYNATFLPREEPSVRVHVLPSSMNRRRAGHPLSRLTGVPAPGGTAADHMAIVAVSRANVSPAHPPIRASRQLRSADRIGCSHSFHAHANTQPADTAHTTSDGNTAPLSLFIPWPVV